MADQKTRTIKEVNEVGTEIASYSYTASTKDSHASARQTDGQVVGAGYRVDIISSGTNHARKAQPLDFSLEGLHFRIANLSQSVISVFLPSGFPHTVSPDYVPYQIYDSLQAFSSSIAGLLASRAVLEGLGVGGSGGFAGSSDHDGTKSSSATAVVLLNILQESMGRIATILFAWRLGTALEPEAKRWRLAADVFNDIGMILDCLSPMIPTTSVWGWYLRIGVLSGASVLRALCGVAAGSSKATLSQHFAIEENGGSVGELNAKDASQETVISLLGMWAGSVVLSYTISHTATWITLLSLLLVHISMNYLAVRSVCMKTLNRQRANIVLSELWQHDRVLTPAQAAKQERIFERDGLLRWGNEVLGHCQIGVSLRDALLLTGSREHRETGSLIGQNTQLTSDEELFDDARYVALTNPSGKAAVVILKVGATVEDQLMGWFEALLLSRQRHRIEQREIDKTTPILDGKELNEHILRRLEAAGWDTRTAALETRPGRRILIQ